MLHAGNGDNDSKTLKLSEDIDGIVEQVRIEARDIINRLEPQHIDGWTSLITILEDCLNTAKINAKVFQYNPASKK